MLKNIVLDQDVISAPIVQEKISGGSAIISGTFALDEAKNLSIQLNAGALPVTINLIEQRTVGATLGAESVNRSVRAGLIGLIMVMAFMVLTYGRLGWLLTLHLSYSALTLALYKLLPVVLTLPGIAGFLLSVGMAVDSNILILERFKRNQAPSDCRCTGSLIRTCLRFNQRCQYSNTGNSICFGKSF
jgi:preprotein translocase subunit SecD